MKARFIAGMEGLVFSRRRAVLALFALGTLFMGYQAWQLEINAGFEKHLPLKHPYMQTFTQYKEEFGGANRLLVAIRARQGDIFTPQCFEKIKAVTDEVFFLPGVNRSTVTSIYTPNVRFVEIVEGGFSGGNVIASDFKPTPAGLSRVRENILKAGIVGRLVANDFSTALVSAQLVDTDPATGRKLNYLEVSDQLEERIRAKYTDDLTDIHIVGFTKIMGDIADGAIGVVGFFGIALLVTYVLVFLFTHSQRLTLLALACSIIAVVWDLGLLRLLGFGIDPMSILVPFLVFAIGVSHSVQMVNAVAREIREGAGSLDAARRSFRRLVVPGGVALLTDTIGFLTILFIEIRIIRELALTAGLGVMVIILTNLLLLPVLLSYLRFGEGYRTRLIRGAQRHERIWRAISGVARPGPAATILALAAVLLALGLVRAPRLEIGDLHAGVPELRPDSRYNRDVAAITERCSIGMDILTTIVETVPDGCIAYDVMDTVDRFQWRIANVPGVQSTISLAQVAKIINAGWNEGSLKWRVLPRNPRTMVQAVCPVETSTGLLNQDGSVIPVMIFAEDHKAGTIERIVAAAEAFAAEHDSDRHRFRLATGNVGVMAATNEVVAAAQLRVLLWVYGSVVALCLLTFRSWRVTLCIVVPLSIVSVLCYALMSLLGIGLKVSTLPVAALGVGIGVDYGIYIFSRMRHAMAEGSDLREAYFQTLQGTGSAVLVTGLTLSIGVSTWVFSALKFQADMGLLLSFMFLSNMLGALFLLPSLAFYVLRREREAK